MSRTAVMYTEIGCFVCCFCGWMLVCSTLPTEYWNFSEVGDAVLTTVNYYSNLWMDCVSDTTGVSDCKYYPSLMALPVFLHICRALAVGSVILGFWGNVLTLIGMKCTKIGGSEIVNARVTLAAAIIYMASGLTGMAVFSLWGNRMRIQFVDVNYAPQKFELGAALFVGWGGSSLIICGSAVLCYFSGKEGLCSGSEDTLLLRPDAYTRARSRGTYVTARTRGSYLLPTYSKSTAIMPPLFYSRRESRGNRTQRTYRTQKTAASMLPNMDSYV
ncbi:claudin-10 [Clarias gariepinus]|uniref:claudin-10 n=1 Tax=Clarias gariepinus TaxID=13013 RepID=UPI00234C3F94|nr:claudin-10 [Clarias gariepinus]